MESDGEITHLLHAWSNGDLEARERLVPLVYEELRRRARYQFRKESPESTLQPTALVNEVFLRLFDQKRPSWKSQVQFFRIAATLMRRILVDHARKRRAACRGGGVERIPFDEAVIPDRGKGTDVIALDDALTLLEREDPQKASIVELRCFAGLQVTETAEALGISPATVKRKWDMARFWLRRQIRAA